MRSLAKRRFPLFCLVILLTSLLAACSGMLPGTDVNSQSYAESAGEGAKPAINAITPRLVEAERAQRDKQEKPVLGSLIGSAAPYKIGKGDILSITPWGNPELTAAIMSMQTGASAQDATGASPQIPGFVVDQEGMIQFPYIGALKVEGMTVAQAREMLVQKLLHYYKRMELSMRVQAYRSQRIYVGGEVKSPGVQPINDIPMTLMEAISRAGGFLSTGDQSRIAVNHAGTAYQLNLPQLIEQGIDPTKIVLADGDVVRVRSLDESKVFVIGEVNTPKALHMIDGRMTLNQALGEAGGMNLVSANGRQLYVIRNASSKEPQIYHLDASSPFSMALAENFHLKPRDVVYVDTAAITRWNRFLSQLLPNALSVINTANR